MAIGCLEHSLSSQTKRELGVKRSLNSSTTSLGKKHGGIGFKSRESFGVKFGEIIIPIISTLLISLE
jgi:hypothetical protein